VVFTVREREQQKEEVRKFDVGITSYENHDKRKIPRQNSYGVED
jgi:hypothetical protein